MYERIRVIATQVMIHQGTAMVESQGVFIAECGPGEFLGEATCQSLVTTEMAGCRNGRVDAQGIGPHMCTYALHAFLYMRA